ncbi:hypothetical protein MKW98_006735 [Papaver atlanticum]|uniref:Homeobox domain-containing protein n=1 Tax=Papaver atlanticum TaxID=357466 RepID=A0AAD4T2Q0_9MAGN|nr:hypothetical protein MKW98_006735 [Papaver atlanticum]
MSERFESSGCLHSTANFLDNPSSLAVLGMNGLRQQQQSDQSHVAQQSRRDKLRVPHTSSSHQLQDFAGHLVQLPNKYSALSNNHSDVFRVSSFRDCSSSDLLSHHHHQHDPIPTTNTSSIFPSHNQHSEIHHNPSMLLADERKDVIMNQEPNCVQPSSVIRAISIDHQDSPSFANSSSSYRVVPSDFMPPSSSSKVLNDQQTLSYWKGQQSCDWISNFVNGSSSNNINTNTRSMKEVDFSAAPLYMKHGCNGYQDVQSSFTTSNQVPEISNQDCQKPYGEMNFNNSSLNVYQTSLQDVVTTSSNMGFEMVPLVEQKLRETGNGSSWVDGGNELVLLPSYVNQSSVSQVNEASTTWTNRPVDHGSSSSSHHWNGELGFAADKRGGNFVGGDPTTQSLSLSLSSHRPPSELHAPPYGDRFGSDLNMQYKMGTCSGSQDTRSNNPGYLFLDQLSPTRFKAGNSVENIAGSSAYARRCSGPLGPFTGYATILKNSKFLKPAQQLLDEFCGITGSKLVATERTDKGFREVSSLSDLVNDESEIGRRDGNSGVSSSICSSVGEGRVGSGHCQSYQPEFQQKKAKLLYMLEEVCRRYKQYHQQMQMVVSSFESVAGLDAATPYTSLALKTISKHFRCLKNTIADQLRLIRKALGEDFSSPTSRVSSNKGDATVPRLRFIDQNPGKQAALGNRLGFLETQHHIWRPQRGLPERSVAVLRAWLFEHFLHPYPTDTDKHMLATQTGLTRSQVSNWFINARVRVWKPMVEEMHMLETKASSDVDLSPGRQSSIKPSMVDCSGQRIREYQCNDELMVNPISGRGQEYLNIISSNAEVGQSSEQQWHQEKRSRMECQIPSSGMDGGYMGFIPYHQSALELGGLGSVSLTLGLRRSAESGQQQQQHEDHLRRHFGGQMVHDFVG